MADRLPSKPTRHGSPPEASEIKPAAEGDPQPDRSPTKPKRSFSPNATPEMGPATATAATALSFQLRGDPLNAPSLSSLPFLGTASTAEASTGAPLQPSFTVDLPLLGSRDPMLPPRAPPFRKAGEGDTGILEEKPVASLAPLPSHPPAAEATAAGEGTLLAPPRDGDGGDDDGASSASSSLSAQRGWRNLSPASSSVQSSLNLSLSHNVQQYQQHHASSSHLLRFDDPVLWIDVAPGVQRPLWGRPVTRRALRQGRSVECECRSCHLALVGSPDAGHVLCPACSTVSPMPSFASSTDASEIRGVCVGLKRDGVDDDRDRDDSEETNDDGGGHDEGGGAGGGGTGAAAAAPATRDDPASLR